MFQIRVNGDFDGDGDEDFLWRNTSTGAALIWEMEFLAKVGSNNTGGADPAVWEIQ